MTTISKDLKQNVEKNEKIFGVENVEKCRIKNVESKEIMM